MRRPDPLYTPFYCEENIWHLSAHGRFGDRPRWAVFISNAHKTCALWSQKAASSAQDPVIWDYHVILVAEAESGTLEVWDLDSSTGYPVPTDEYLRATFPFADSVRQPFQPMFRIVEAAALQSTFSSDRSHMRHPETGHWLHPPPPYPPIVSGDRETNLSSFLDMTLEFVGDVVDLRGFRQRFCLNC